MTEKEFLDRFAYNPKKDVIGTGYWGITYKVYDTLEKKFVALKVARVREEPKTFSLADEVRLSRQVDYHVNVARYEHGLRVESPVQTDYAVMDFYTGGHLDDFLRKHRANLTPTEIRDLLIGILNGVLHLHQEGVILKYLHPNHILIHINRASQFIPKIATLGTRPFQLPDMQNAVFFPNMPIPIDFQYIAPELIVGKNARLQSDIWSLGCIAYKILTHEVAFDAPAQTNASQAIEEIKNKIIEATLPPLFQSLSPLYQAFLKLCWHPIPEKRAKSVKELIHCLISPVPVEIPTFPPKNAPPSARKWERIRTFMTVAAVILPFTYWIRPSEDLLEYELLSQARQENTIPAWNNYIKNCHNSMLLKEARQRIDSLTELRNFYLQSAEALWQGNLKAEARQAYMKALAMDSSQVHFILYWSSEATEL